MEDQEKQEISWKSLSLHQSPNKKRLFLLSAVLFIGAIILLIYKYDTLTAVLMIVSSAVLLLYAYQKPKTSETTIDSAGILINDRMHYYDDLKSFWIEYVPGEMKELSLESAKWYMPYIKIQLEEQNPVEIRSFIINFLPEKEHVKSLADHVNKKLGL